MMATVRINTEADAIENSDGSDLFGSNMELHSVLYSIVNGNDIELCRVHLKRNLSHIGLQNSRGETALHLSSMGKADPLIMTMLINKGGDVNVVNKWRQTPLHYAALDRSTEKIELLLNNPATEIKKDLNGYNAMHCLTYSCEEQDGVWSEGVQKFVRAGLDINSQTNYGQHILHIVCNKNENINFLRYLLSQFSNIQTDKSNSDEEIFLHAFVMYGLDPDANEFLDELMSGEYPACSRDMFRKLLNQKDINGQTPFSMLLDSPAVSRKMLKKLIDFGACVKVTTWETHHYTE